MKALSPLVQAVTCSQAAVVSLINASSCNDFVTLEVVLQLELQLLLGKEPPSVNYFKEIHK